MSAVDSALWWAAEYLFASTALFTAAWSVARATGSLRVREAAWKAALLGSLGAATLSPWPWPGFRPPSAARGGPVDVEFRGGIRPADLHRALNLPAQDRGERPTPPWKLLLLLAWWGGAARGLAGLARSGLAERKIIGPREPVLDPAWLRSLARVRGCFRLRRPVRLTAGDGLATPAALGWSEVCVPTPLLAALSAGQRESILAHELAHLARLDAQWSLAAQAVAAACFFQPLNRVAVRELHRLAEFRCDDAAVARTGLRRELAESLALCAERRRPAAGLAALGGPESQLVARVGRILGARRVAAPSPAGRLAWGLVVPLLCAGSLVAAQGPRLLAPAAPTRRVVEVEVEEATGHGGRGPAGPARARLRQRSGGVERALTATRGVDGHLRLVYSEDGRPRALTPEAAAWAGGLLRPRS